MPYTKRKEHSYALAQMVAPGGLVGTSMKTALKTCVYFTHTTVFILSIRILLLKTAAVQSTRALKGRAYSESVVSCVMEVIKFLSRLAMKLLVYLS